MHYKTQISIINSKSYLAEGKRRCGNNFGILPTLRISVYGRFFATTIFHKPIKPAVSGIWPSEESVCKVTSSTNITKQTFFLENRVTWKRTKDSQLKCILACTYHKIMINLFFQITESMLQDQPTEKVGETASLIVHDSSSFIVFPSIALKPIKKS